MHLSFLLPAAFTHVIEAATAAAPPAAPDAAAVSLTGEVPQHISLRIRKELTVAGGYQRTMPRCFAGNAASTSVAAAAAEAETKPSAPRRTHTPSRTGLTARAVRLPSRLGLTPGERQPDPPPFAVAASSAAGGAAPATTRGAGGNLKSILKRLNFSTTKGRGAAAPAAGDASAAGLPTVQRQPTASAAAESTIKQLRFDVGATPAATAAAPSGAGGRHVSFDSAAVSPAARERPVRPTNAAGTPTWLTPEPTVLEADSAGSSGSEGSSTPVAGSVNSAAAGHTPYDRRLSSLMRKYQAAGTPELPDDELDELAAGGLRGGEQPWVAGSSRQLP